MDEASEIIVYQLEAENNNLRRALEEACQYIHCSTGSCPCVTYGCSATNYVDDIIDCLLNQN